jgi:hypothetical protein
MEKDFISIKILTNWKPYGRPKEAGEPVPKVEPKSKGSGHSDGTANELSTPGHHVRAG